MNYTVLYNKALQNVYKSKQEQELRIYYYNLNSRITEGIFIVTGCVYLYLYLCF